jgi:GLPGLI family protein
LTKTFVMRKYFLFAFVSASLLAQAQQPEGRASQTESRQLKEGRIIYELTMQLPTRVTFGPGGPGGPPPDLPKARTDQYELLFGNNQSLYQFLPTANNEDPGTFSGGGMVIRMGGTNDIVYHNLEAGTRVEQREIMDRSFVVADSIRRMDWKLTDETKTILDHIVRKAIGRRVQPRTLTSMENGEIKRTVISDTVEVIAWFTSNIPLAIGPGEMQGQLPGAILEASINKGQTVYRAVEISPKVSIAKIKEPKDGKRLTQAEFVKEREKLMEEMRRNMPDGGRGNVIRLN